MRMNDMILVSVDDHSIEPPDICDRHLPQKYKDQAPKIIRNDQGVDLWVFQGLDTTRQSKDEWRKQNEAAGIGFVPSA